MKERFARRFLFEGGLLADLPSVSLPKVGRIFCSETVRASGASVLLFGLVSDQTHQVSNPPLLLALFPCILSTLDCVFDFFLVSYLQLWPYFIFEVEAPPVSRYCNQRSLKCCNKQWVLNNPHGLFCSSSLQKEAHVHWHHDLGNFQAGEAVHVLRVFPPTPSQQSYPRGVCVAHYVYGLCSAGGSSCLTSTACILPVPALTSVPATQSGAGCLGELPLPLFWISVWNERFVNSWRWISEGLCLLLVDLVPACSGLDCPLIWTTSFHSLIQTQP